MANWTARSCAIAAALCWGSATAQDVDQGPALAAQSDIAADSAEKVDSATTATIQDAAAPDPLPPQAESASPGDLPPATPPDSAADQTPAISDHIRAATANLNIDDATRSRYRYRNGEWWFETKSGNWMYYRDGQWQSFDPATYTPSASSVQSAPLSSSTFVAPSGSGSSIYYYYYPSQPYSSYGYVPSYGYSYSNYGPRNYGYRSYGLGYGLGGYGLGGYGLGGYGLRNYGLFGLGGLGGYRSFGSGGHIHHGGGNIGGGGIHMGHGGHHMGGMGHMGGGHGHMGGGHGGHGGGHH